MNRPYSEACEQNKAVIFETIEPYLKGRVLEIGSGTGQHAVYFAGLRPEIIWQTSDVAANLPDIEAWISHSALANLPAPLALDVFADWPEQKFDLVFSANCFHIMDEAAVEKSFSGIAECLKAAGVFIVYGPFNYGGAYTSASNEQFDYWLKARNPKSGIKDLDWIETLANAAQLDLLEDKPMPSNNRTLIWQNRTL